MARRTVGRLSLLAALLPLLMCPARAEDPGEVLIRAWDFTKATDSLGWLALQSVAPLTVRDGALQCVTTGIDPFVASPLFEDPIPTGAMIRVTLRATKPGYMQWFWSAGPAESPSGFRGGDEIPFILDVADEWRTYTLAPKWRVGDVLRQIRLDSPEGIGGRVEVQRVELIARPLPAGLGEQPEWDFRKAGLATAFAPGPGMGGVFPREGTMVCRPLEAVATVTSPPCTATAEDLGVARIEVRSDRAVDLDILFRRKGTELQPPGDYLRLALEPSTEFRVLNLDLKRCRDFRGAIEGLALRIWRGAGAEIEVRNLALAATPAGPAQLALASCRAASVVSDNPRSLDLVCTVANLGGSVSAEGELLAEASPPLRVSARSRIPSVRPLESVTVPLSVPLPADFTGGVVEASVTLAGCAPQSVRGVVIPACPPSLRASSPDRPVEAFFSDDGQAVLRNGLVTLVVASAGSVPDAGVLYDTSGPAIERVGSFPSLGSIRTPAGVSHLLAAGNPAVAAGPRGAELLFPVRVGAGLDARAGRVRFAVEARSPEVLCELRLEGAAGPLTGVLFPDFLAGDGATVSEPDLAVFPGLEYLLPGERSSGLDNVGPPGNERLAPHPYKVTLPAMWATYRQRTVGMWWDPLQEWGSGAVAPGPVFSSPDILTGTAGRRFGLTLPGAAGGAPENVLGTVTASATVAELGGPLRLAASIFVLRGGDAEPAVSYALARLAGSQTPSPPPLPGPAPDLARVLADAAHGLSAVAWVPELAMWHTNIPEARTPVWSAACAETLATWLARGASGPEADRAREVLDQAVAARRATGEPIGTAVAMREGGLGPQLRSRVAEGHSLAERVRPDGSVGYIAGGALRASFGVDGDSASGETGAVAAELLAIAAETLDSVSLEAGLRACDWLATQARPEGAQVWELPLHVPDVLAAADCVRACVRAYELTGDPKRLAQARAWAWRGMVFVYAWSPPERPIMRYGSVPVFGASHFVHGWFGRIVQWNGLVFADALLDLARWDDSFAWDTVARGLTLSGAQQMRPSDPASSALAHEVPDCGHVGLYPDCYDPIAETDAYHWCLEPSPLARVAARLEGGIGPLTVKPLMLGRRRVSLSTVAVVQDAELGETALVAEIVTPPALGSHVLAVAGLAAQEVSIGGSALPRVEDVDADTGLACWSFDETTGAVLVRLQPSDAPARLVVTGPASEVTEP